MKTIDYTYGGKTLHLYHNGAAMFALSDLDDTRPEDAPEVMAVVRQTTAEGFDILCQVAHILAQQGELCRRYLGHTPERVPTAEELRLLLTPMQMLTLRTAVFRALNDGYTNNSDDSGGDIDTGLAELEKKTKP